MKRPMKGVQVTDLSTLKYPLVASPKIDGFRCILGRYPKTSRLSNFPNNYFHTSLTGLLPPEVLLDGEVVVGNKNDSNVLSATSSGLTSVEGIPNYTLWVFDYYDLTKPFSYRFEKAAEVVSRLNHPRVKLLDHVYINNSSELQKYVDKCLDDNYEGVMVRNPDAFYKQGRSTLREMGLLKIKPFEDFEATITGYYEEQENTNEALREATGKLKRSSAKAGKILKGTLGGFTAVLDDNTPIRVGTGFTHSQRIKFWEKRDSLIGARVKCKKQSTGELNKPRHPIFLSLRPDWD